MAKRNDVLRTGEVTVEKGDKVYTARYEVLKGRMVRLEAGRTTQLGGMTAEQVAPTLLFEITTPASRTRAAWDGRRSEQRRPRYSRRLRSP